jgi:hypothetical protein
MSFPSTASIRRHILDGVSSMFMMVKEKESVLKSGNRWFKCDHVIAAFTLGSLRSARSKGRVNTRRYPALHFCRQRSFEFSLTPVIKDRVNVPPPEHWSVTDRELGKFVQDGQEAVAPWPSGRILNGDEIESINMACTLTLCTGVRSRAGRAKFVYPEFTEKEERDARHRPNRCSRICARVAATSSILDLTSVALHVNERTRRTTDRDEVFFPATERSADMLEACNVRRSASAAALQPSEFEMA